MSGKSGPIANSMYASSNTTIVRSGTRTMKCSTSSLVTIVAVGLWGFATNTSFVIAVIARAIASRSSRKSFSMTITRTPPAAWTIIGYTTNDGWGTTASSPGRRKGRASRARSVRGRACAEHDLVGIPPVLLAQRLPQIEAAPVRVPVQRRERGDDGPLQPLGGRARGLVLGGLDRIVDHELALELLDRLTWLVRSDAQDVLVRDRLPLRWHALSFTGPGTIREPSGTRSAHRSPALP